MILIIIPKYLRGVAQLNQNRVKRLLNERWQPAKGCNGCKLMYQKKLIPKIRVNLLQDVSY